MRMQPDETTTRHPHDVMGLYQIGELCLMRHLATRKDFPKRPTAMYLRQTIACARTIARLAKAHPDWLTHAYLLLEAVITAAQDTEEALFHTGRNSAPYLNVWIAAESLLVQLQDREAQLAPPPSTEAAPPPSPSRRATGTLLPTAVEMGRADGESPSPFVEWGGVGVGPSPVGVQPA